MSKQVWLDKLVNAESEDRVYSLVDTAPIEFFADLNIFKAVIEESVSSSFDDIPWRVIRAFLESGKCDPDMAHNKAFTKTVMDADRDHRDDLADQNDDFDQVVSILEEMRFRPVRSAVSRADVCEALEDLLDVGDVGDADKKNFLWGLGGAEFLTENIVLGLFDYVKKRNCSEDFMWLVGRPDDDGWTVLHWIARENSLKCLKKMKKILRFLRRTGGKHNSPDVVARLEDFGRGLTALRNEAGDTVFAVAARCSNLVLLMDLVENGIIGETVSDYGLNNRDYLGRAAEDVAFSSPEMKPEIAEQLAAFLLPCLRSACAEPDKCRQYVGHISEATMRSISYAPRVSRLLFYTEQSGKNFETFLLTNVVQALVERACDLGVKFCPEGQWGSCEESFKKTCALGWLEIARLILENFSTESDYYEYEQLRSGDNTPLSLCGDLVVSKIVSSFTSPIDALSKHAKFYEVPYEPTNLTESTRPAPLLHVACRCGAPITVRTILAGCSHLVGLKDANGKTPRDFAEKLERRQPRDEILELLDEHEAAEAIFAAADNKEKLIQTVGSLKRSLKRKRADVGTEGVGGTTTCRICEDAKADHTLPGCGHVYCKGCWMKSRSRCPSCRISFESRDLVKLHFP